MLKAWLPDNTPEHCAVCIIVVTSNCLCPLLHQVLDPPQITARIKNSSTEQQLGLLIQQHLDSMNAINLAAAIMKLQKVRCRDHQLYTACVQRYLQFPSEHTARGLANVVYALCKSPPAIRQRQEALLQQQLLPAFVAMCSAAEPQGLSNVLYGAAISRQQLGPEQLQQLLGVFVSMLQTADSQAVSNTLWAVATMGQQVPEGQLQQLLDASVSMLQQATPQNVSNILWAVATMGQQVPAGQLQKLLDAFAGMLQQASSQAIANALWAVATMGCQVPGQQLQQLLVAFVSMLQQSNVQNISNTMWAVATMGQQVPEGQLQQLLGALVSMLQQATPQSVSNTLWSVATMGQQVPEGQLQQLLGAFVSMLQQANTQDMSDTMWAVATMGQQVPARQLQQLLSAFVSMLQHAKPQNVSNTLWACAKLGFLPQQLLAAPGLAGLLAEGNPQGLANAAWACGELGHRDEQLMQILLAEVEQRLAAGTDNSSAARSFNIQNICNVCWAMAVLDLQQHAQQVLQFMQACSSMWSSSAPEGLQQLWQVHTWLLDFKLAGGQGLQGSLTEQQLQQCKAAWDQALQQTAKQQHTEFQHSVFAAVQRLGIAWQQQPQMEQLSVGRDGVTPDGALLLDIAGRTAAGVLVAVEADGPTHFRRPDGELMGTTQYRNRALAVRGYRLVSVPGHEWRKVWSDEQGQEQYLMQLFKEAGVISGQPVAELDTDCLKQAATSAKRPQAPSLKQQKQRAAPAKAAARALMSRAGLPAQGSSQQVSFVLVGTGAIAKLCHVMLQSISRLVCISL
jgi:hypothetical protein